MAIIVKNIEEVTKELAKQLVRKEMLVERAMLISGEKAVNAQRTTHANDYMDQTGNLRSSIGYVVANNGQIVGESSFSVVKQGIEGGKKGREFAERNANDTGTDIVLTMVAGMEYAKYVQDIHHKDVLYTAELVAEREIKNRLKTIGIK